MAYSNQIKCGRHASVHCSICICIPLKRSSGMIELCSAHSDQYHKLPYTFSSYTLDLMGFSIYFDFSRSMLESILRYLLHFSRLVEAIDHESTIWCHSYIQGTWLPLLAHEFFWQGIPLREVCQSSGKLWSFECMEASLDIVLKILWGWRWLVVEMWPKNCLWSRYMYIWKIYVYTYT